MSNPTPMSFDDAVAAVTRFSALFEGVKIIASQVKDDQLREQLIREAEERKAKIDADTEAARTVLASTNADIADAKNKLKEAQGKAFDVTSAADARARSLVADANARAASILDKAKADADSLLAGARADLAAKRDEIERLLAEIAAHEAELAGKKADKDALDKSIADARALIATMMGAK